MQPTNREKILVIRFSSIGDVAQALSAPQILKSLFTNSEVHFLSRKDMADLLGLNPALDKCFYYNKQSGLIGLIRLILSLSNENYTRIYDCHNNLRSNLVRFFLQLLSIFKGQWALTLKRPTQRFKRFVLLNFKKNLFKKPFNGQMDQLSLLRLWGWNLILPEAPVLKAKNFAVKLVEFEKYFCLAPSAAHELKRWPVEYWRQLIGQHLDKKFVILGGPSDLFTNEISETFKNVQNLSGCISLQESAFLIQNSCGLIANDTGLMHIAEQMAIPTIVFMGPAPFGFPARLDRTYVLENSNLACRPCSKHGQGPCTNINFHECLRSITPLHPALNLWIEKNWQ